MTRLSSIGVRALAAGCLVAAVAGPATPARPATLGDVRFADSLASRGAALDLHGLALHRYRWLFEVYVAALYLPEGTPVEQLLRDTPRRFEIHYLYGFSAEDFRRATREGIRKNVGAAEAERLSDAIRRFNALYRDVEPGDRYALTYIPGRGTEIALNGEPLGVVEGEAFSRALFSIWFGPEPFDQGLKRELLAGSP